jgi:hypothetical protein
MVSTNAFEALVVSYYTIGREPLNAFVALFPLAPLGGASLAG